MKATWFLVLAFIAGGRYVEGGGKVSLFMEYYSNPSQKTYKGECCERTIFFSNWCTDKCDTFFKVCLKAGGHEICERTGVFYDINYIHFSSSLKNGVRNPITLHFPDGFQSKVGVMIDVVDRDQYSADDLIAHFEQTIYVNGSKSSSGPYVQSVFRSHGSILRYRLSVLCDFYYYGPDCGKFCMPTYDGLNRYKCDRTSGRKICNPGWGGEECDKDLNKCRLRPCRNGGTCQNNGPERYQCLCIYGYTGKHCETILDPCRHYLKLGTWDNTTTYSFQKVEATGNITIDRAWYRYASRGSLASTCNLARSCNAFFTVYTSAELPLVEEGIVEQNACVAYNRDCCSVRMHIKAKKCAIGHDKFVVYKLRIPLVKEMKFCFDLGNPGA